MKQKDLEFQLLFDTFDRVDQKNKDVQDIPYFSRNAGQSFVVRYYKDSKGEINMRYCNIDSGAWTDVSSISF